MSTNGSALSEGLGIPRHPISMENSKNLCCLTSDYGSQWDVKVTCSKEGKHRQGTTPFLLVSVLRLPGFEFIQPYHFLYLSDKMVPHALQIEFWHIAKAVTISIPSLSTQFQILQMPSGGGFLNPMNMT